MKKIVLGCAAVLLSLGLLAGCNKEDEIIEPGPEENPNGEDGGDAGSEAETTLVKLGAFTDTDASWHYVDGGLSTASTPSISTTTEWESAPWITVTKVTGGATLSIEEEGKEVQYIVYSGSSTIVNFSTSAYTWAWNEEYETFGTTDGTRAFGLNTTYDDVRAYSLSGFAYDVVEVLTKKPEDIVVPTSYQEVTTLADGENYILGIEISETLYFFNGKIVSDYYLGVTPTYKNAVEVTTTAIENEEEASEWGLSFELDGAAKEIYAYQGPSSSTEGKYYEDLGICEKGATPEDHNATKTFTWDSTTCSFSVTFGEGDDTTTKILGLKSSSTYKEITLVDATEEVTADEGGTTTVDNLRAHLYSPVFDTDETPA